MSIRSTRPARFSFSCLLLLAGVAQTCAAQVQWVAHWIAAAPESQTAAAPLPIFRTGFQIPKKLSSATLLISGLGQYEVHLNGHPVTDALLTPGWTDYRKHVFYDTYDVTSLLQRGGNAIGVMLGNGMYSIPATESRYAKFRGSFGPPKLIVQLQLRFDDGTQSVVASNAQWKSAPGPITFTSIYGGEDYDARLEQPGWDTAAFNDGSWAAAREVPGPGGELIPESIPPVKAFQRFATIAVTHPKPGLTVYDLGQNFAGWPEIAVSGAAGTSVRMLPGELLDANGFVTQRGEGGSPDSPTTFNYVLKGQGIEHWHPRFSYYGFRYVQVETSSPVDLKIDGRFLHDAVNVDGTFTSSDVLFNRIHALINRAMLSNMMSVLTDCPHREKLGWLEETHLAGAALMYNYDLQALYNKISNDMADSQLADGLVPDIAPEFPVFGGPFRDSPEWGSAVVLSPWVAYQFYGDVATLRSHYASMQRYVAYLGSKTKDHLLAYGLGDWYDIGPRAPGESQLTGKGVTASAIYYQDLTTLARIANLLGAPQDAARYTAEAVEVKAAFNQRFFHAESNQYDTGSQTANAMPLVVGLVPEDQRAAVLDHLVADIRKHTNHVTAGDVGFHYVVRALTDGGRSDVLYDMLSRTDKPSYGDQLAHGATALTEAWDANPASSQNHFMLGHAEEWFYRGLAGIDLDMSRATDERILLHPAIVGTIESVSASFQSRLGLIRSSWSRKGDRLHLELTVPAGATATATLPSGKAAAIRVNGAPLTSSAKLREIHATGTQVSLVLAGGTYQFDMPFAALAQ